VNKYHRNNYSKKNSIMDNNGQSPETSASSQIETKREIIRDCLNEIIIVVESRLRAAAVSVPIFLTVPNSGASIVTMATPLDPSDDLWAHIVEIVCETVSERLGGLKLRTEDTICAAANTKMGAADLTAD
jgi:hypothetical protein